MNLRTVKWARCDKTQSRELLTKVCLRLCTTSVHNTAQNSSDNLLSWNLWTSTFKLILCAKYTDWYRAYVVVLRCETTGVRSFWAGGLERERVSSAALIAAVLVVINKKYQQDDDTTNKKHVTGQHSNITVKAKIFDIWRLIAQGLTSHQTHYRSYRGQFLQVVWFSTSGEEASITFKTQAKSAQTQH